MFRLLIVFGFMSLFSLRNNQSHLEIRVTEALPNSCSHYPHVTAEDTMLCSVHQHRGIMGPYNSSREPYHQAGNGIRVTRLLGCVLGAGVESESSLPTLHEQK